MHNVSRETKVKQYVDLLFEWNKAINLISRKMPESVLFNTHIQQSIKMATLLDEQNILDFGSGSGLPGIIVSICNDAHVMLVEVSSKKCAFLREVVRVLNLNATVYNMDIRSLENITPQVVISKAAANLDKLFLYTGHLNNQGNLRYLISKGEFKEKEIQNTYNKWSFKLQEHVNDSTNMNVLLDISKVKRANGTSSTHNIDSESERWSRKDHNSH